MKTWLKLIVIEMHFPAIVAVAQRNAPPRQAAEAGATTARGDRQMSTDER
jgi:hypothetical protein